MATKEGDTHVINPITGRLILKTSKIYSRLLKSGHIKPKAEPDIVEPVRAELKQIAYDNSDKLENLSRSETDKLLRKLLIDKLTLKKKKKKKHYSESESSESE
jgi:MOSC domain-containing protein YiiM